MIPLNTKTPRHKEEGAIFVLCALKAWPVLRIRCRVVNFLLVRELAVRAAI
jgi:hypothetical protein